MASTLHALGGILLNGLPTFFLILLLNFYLKAVFFKPLEHTLAKRLEMTEGARNAASTALAAAAARTAEHQAAIRQARTSLYAAQEKQNKHFEDEQSTALEAVHAEAENSMRSAKARIESQSDAARRELSVQSDLLAELIAASILKGKAA